MPQDTAPRIEIEHTQEDRDPPFSEIRNTSESLQIGKGNISNAEAWSGLSNGTLNDQIHGAVSSEYTSNNSPNASFESMESNHVESHEFFSPSMYNTALYGDRAYLEHKLDLKFKKSGRFCPQRANVNQILLYKDPTMLLHTFFEEP